MLARSGSSQATLHEAVPSASRTLSLPSPTIPKSSLTELSLSDQAEKTHTTYNGMVVKSDTPQVAPDNKGKSSCILFQTMFSGKVCSCFVVSLCPSFVRLLSRFCAYYNLKVCI